MTSHQRVSNVEFSSRFEKTSFWLFIGTLAWAPFPLGSNRQWSVSLLVLLIACSWLLWWISVWNNPALVLKRAKRIAVPLILAGLALLWGLLQTVPWLPASWLHPNWSIAADIMGKTIAGAISLNPWRTGFEVLKLSAYGAAAWLVYMFSLRAERANQLLNAVIIIGGLYAAYSLLLWALQTYQYELFYDTKRVTVGFSGPFVLKNSYATYAGLAAIASIVRLFESGQRSLRIGHGFRPYMFSLLQYITRRGALLFLGFVLTFSTVIFSASRAGFVSTLFGLTIVLLFSLPIAARRATRWRGVLAAIAAVALIIVLFQISGDNLQARLDALIQTGNPDPTRLLAWNSAERMISDSPWLGLGLGSFEDAFPIYANQVVPFVLDKAHNDHLELAAGWGLPAAILWWSAFLWLNGLCVRAIFVRHRHRIYPLIALGATTLVGLHSAFDFSLQIPAISLSYATLLGLGVGQAFSKRDLEV